MISRTTCQHKRIHNHVQTNDTIRAYQKRCSATLFTATLAHKDGTYAHTAFMPGCALVAYSPRLVQTVYTYLSSYLPGIGLMQQCCATPALCMKDPHPFSQAYSKLQYELESHNFHTVITTCSNCFMTLRHFSPKITVSSLYDVLVQIGIPQRNYSTLPVLVLHDPCPTRREDTIHITVRTLLDMMSLRYEEFTMNRRKTQCCGQANMLALKDGERSLAYARKRCAQTERECIVSYCQSCLQAFHKAGKRGIHILELIFSEHVCPDYKQRVPCTLLRWFNRWRSRRQIRRLALLAEKKHAL